MNQFLALSSELQSCMINNPEKVQQLLEFGISLKELVETDPKIIIDLFNKTECLHSLKHYHNLHPDQFKQLKFSDRCHLLFHPSSSHSKEMIANLTPPSISCFYKKRKLFG